MSSSSKPRTPKVPKPYLLNLSLEQANVAFYDGYDPHFLFRKAGLLYLAYTKRDQFKTFLEEVGEDGNSLDERYFHGLAAELHCSVLQQFECLFALMLAAFNPLPHWIYLTEYKTNQMRQSISDFLAGNISAITGGQCTTPLEFIAQSVYPGVECPVEHRSAWDRSVGDLLWIIMQIASLNSKGAEYNAYKHGLRILTGSSRLAVEISAGKGIFQPLVSMQHCLTFLEFTDEPEGRRVQQVTKQISPEHAYNALKVMGGIAEVIKTLRLAGLKRVTTSVPMFAIDRQGLLQLEPNAGFSMSL